MRMPTMALPAVSTSDRKSAWPRSSASACSSSSWFWSSCACACAMRSSSSWRSSVTSRKTDETGRRPLVVGAPDEPRVDRDPPNLARLAHQPDHAMRRRLAGAERDGRRKVLGQAGDTILVDDPPTERSLSSLRSAISATPRMRTALGFDASTRPSRSKSSIPSSIASSTARVARLLLRELGRRLLEARVRRAEGEAHADPDRGEEQDDAGRLEPG